MERVLIESMQVVLLVMAATPQMADASQRRRNSALWAGAFLTVLGVLSNFLYFLTNKGESIFPWLTLLISAAGLFFLLAGLKRAFGQPQVFRGKIAGSIVTLLALPLFALTVWGFFSARALPASSHAPQIGQKAPEFTLTNTSGQPVSLAQLLSSPLDAASGKAPKAVLLVFYRGWW